jgi:hypothetical protein
VTPDAWTAVGTIALAAATFVSTGFAVWQPRREERRRQKVAAELDQWKCNVASVQMRNWAERQPSDHWVIHLMSDVSYPVRPVVGGMVGHNVTVDGISVTQQPDGQKLLVLDRGDDTRLDMWFVVFFDPEGSRRMLIAFFANGGGRACIRRRTSRI